MNNLYKKVLGNIYDGNLDLSHFHCEKLILDQDDLLKQMIVAYSDHHSEVVIALDDNQKLRDGDILFQDDHHLLFIIINTNKLIKIMPSNMSEMGYIAHNLGNRHTPSQFIDQAIYVIYDPLIEEWLSKQGYQYEIGTYKLNTPFKYAKL